MIQMKRILLIAITILITLVSFGQDKGDRKAEKEIDKFYFKATDLYFFHEYDSAIIKLDILDFLYEENSNIKFFIGMCYFFKSDFEKAVKYYEQCKQEDIIYTMNYQNGKYVPHVVYFYLAFSYEKLGKIDDAIRIYKKYMELEKEENIIFNTSKKIEMLNLIYNKTE
jgi:tetratricopeptide (TPR) repeat protein